ncbi:ATP-binding cassette domain-containing protein [Mycoplasma sp. P36-A1]|uniref:ATP-binding cassette domain-containing protein n=1 Tax=Mycoplasma sp. P36-A1 TaxID=3252900 RepID=UPI003C2AEDCA
MLQIKDLSFSYDSNIKVLDNLNATFESGQVVAIQGKSGQGKSTLLTILAGLENNYSGELLFDNKVIEKKDLFEYNKENVSIIFQELNLIKYLSIDDNIKQGYLVKNKQYSAENLEKFIKKFDMDTINLGKMPATLSGGQQQRVAIIRALLSNTKIILADEPTSSVDSENSLNIIHELRKIAQEEDKIIIVVTHDDIVAKECDKTYLLNNNGLTQLNPKISQILISSTVQSIKTDENDEIKKEDISEPEIVINTEIVLEEETINNTNETEAEIVKSDELVLEETSNNKEVIELEEEIKSIDE